MEDHRIGGELHLILDVKKLLEDYSIGHHDEEAGHADHLQGEVVEAAHNCFFNKIKL